MGDDMLAVQPLMFADQGYSSRSSESSVLTDIFATDTQIAIWTDQLSEEARTYSHSFKHLHGHFSVRQVLTPESMPHYLSEVLKHGEGREDLIQAISTLSEMFCYLFELESLGFRMQLLDRAMCPKFHRDYVPCRLVMTLKGQGTQWVDDQCAAEALGNDQYQGDFHQLNEGDIALLKGAGWFGNESKGLIHRSPQVSEGDWRLFLSMDFAN